MGKKKTNVVEKSIGRVAAGCVLLVLWVLVTLALITYDAQDTVDWSIGGREVSNAIGPLGAWLVRGLYLTFGVSAWLFPLILAWLGAILILRTDVRPWTRVAWLALLLGGACVLTDLQGGFWGRFKTVEECTGGLTGGFFGYFLCDLLLKKLLGWVGAGLVGFGMIVAGLFGVFRVWPSELWSRLKEGWGEWQAEQLERRRERMAREAEEEKRKIALRKEQLALEKEQARTQRELDKLAHEERVARERAERAEQKERDRIAREDRKEREREEREAAAAEREAARLEKEAAKAAAVAELESARIERLRLEAEAEERAKREAAEAAEAARIRAEQEKAEKQRLREQMAKAEAERRAREEADRAAAAAAAKKRAAERAQRLQETTWELPTMDLLDPLPEGAGERLGSEEAEATGEIIRATLETFNIMVSVEHVEMGPVVTRYELKPEPGVKVERIAALAGNITLALKAESVRVEAPIPGKGRVGIEVPNAKAAPVVLRQVLESGTWNTSTAKLPLALGEDVGGQVVVADLTSLPHLLVAGATSMGKSVCLNTLLVGLLMSRTPDELGLILVDPKVVEFSDYAALPHLMVPVITSAKKVAEGLRWAIGEMRRRFTLFSEVGVRDIASYNTKVAQEEEERRQAAEAAAEAAEAEEGEEPGAEDADAVEGEAEEVEAGTEEGAEGGAEEVRTRLKYIVIVIDELADLMLEAQADIEPAITKLTQLARATGIHMIIATQRPTVNIITGTIKSNVPGRIAFKVAQKNDSRVILDREGADKLVRKGDMLVLAGSNKLVRAQGAWTKDNEIRAVVGWWKRQGAPCYDETLKANLDAAERAGSGKTGTLPGLGDEGGDGEDELVEQALEVIRASRRASTSAIQRKLRVGFNRAARIMDLLEERGYVGPANGAGPREILFDLDEETEFGGDGD